MPVLLTLMPPSHLQKRMLLRWVGVVWVQLCLSSPAEETLPGMISKQTRLVEPRGTRRDAATSLLCSEPTTFCSTEPNSHSGCFPDLLFAERRSGKFLPTAVETRG